jgi:4'-phosphopantetheinyl transferase
MTNQTAPAPIELQLYRVDLQADTRAFASGLRQLSPDEHAQASRCRTEAEHRRFVLIHARLREIVGRYLDVSPRSVRFELDATGRRVLDPRMQDGVHFDASHAGELGVVALAGAPVGIDLETVRNVDDALAQADARFSAAECSALRRETAASLPAQYLRCLTHKRAALRACGRGLAEMAQFTVALDRPRQQLGLPDLRRLDQPSSIECVQARTSLLTLLHLSPASDCIGAVAVTAADVTLRWKT